MPLADWQAVLLSMPALALFGLCVGSFLNVVIHRLPQQVERDLKEQASDILGLPAPDLGPPLTLSHPPSRCPSCGHRIRWYEHIPVVSWLALRGRCSSCKTGISARYPAIEILCGVLFAAMGWLHGPHPVTLAWCGFAALLLAAALIDWDTTYLPDVLTGPLLWGGLVAATLGWTIPLPDAVWGAVGGFMSLWTVAAAWKLVRGEIGMADGDFILLAGLGAWLGWQMLLPLVLAASAIGAIVGIGMWLSGALREGRYVPFGPFLAGAGLAVLFAGRERVFGWMGWA